MLRFIFSKKMLFHIAHRYISICACEVGWMRVRACVFARVRVCARACLDACVFGCVRVRMRACLGTYIGYPYACTKVYLHGLLECACIYVQFSIKLFFLLEILVDLMLQVKNQLFLILNYQISPYAHHPLSNKDF